MIKKNLLMRLDQYSSGDFQRGASRVTEAAWVVIQATLFSSWLPGSGWRCALLRAFGATIGTGVVIKPHASVKFPWRLQIENHVWIGEGVWIDNLAQVTIGSHSCISQGAYLCTGSHDWSDANFSLVTKPITIGAGCWIGARATLAPGAIVEDGAILAMHAAGRRLLKSNTIYRNDGSTKPRTQVSDK